MALAMALAMAMAMALAMAMTMGVALALALALGVENELLRFEINGPKGGNVFAESLCRSSCHR